MYRKLSDRLMTKTGLFFVAFIIQIVMIPLCSIPTIPDEINPLALGFLARGDNWRQYLIADGYYYKYGRLIFYFPFIYFIKNSVILYRAMLVVNASIVSFIPVCVYEIVSQHLKSSDKKINYYISLLTATIPAVTLNSKYTWSEPVLMVLPWIILLLLLNSMEGEKSKKGRWFYSIVTAVAQVYAYMIHTRGIVILIATLLCVCLLRILFHNKNIQLRIYFAATLLLLTFDREVGTVCQKILYGSTENLTGGSLSFLSSEFIDKFFTLNGFKVWGEEMIGWLFASVVSTFGLVSLGLVASFTILVRFRAGKANRQELLIIIFSLLCFFGALVLGTVYFLDNLLMVNGLEITERGDKLVYARYLNGASVCISFIGLYFTMMKGKLWTAARVFYSFIFFVLLHGFFISVIAKRIDNTIIWSQNMVTINYFCDLEQCVRGGMYSLVNLQSGGIAVFSLTAFLIFFATFINRRRENVFFSLYLTAFLMAYIWNSYNVLYRADTYMMQVIEEYNDVIKSVRGEEELTNIYLDDEILRCGFQYYFSDYYVLTKRDSNRENIEDMFIISPDGTYNKELFDDDYFEVLDAGGENLDSHIYVKGSALNDRLQEKGYRTQRIVEGE